MLLVWASPKFCHMEKISYAPNPSKMTLYLILEQKEFWMKNQLLLPNLMQVLLSLKCFFFFNHMMNHKIAGITYLLTWQHKWLMKEKWCIYSLAVFCGPVICVVQFLFLAHLSTTCSG